MWTVDQWAAAFEQPALDATAYVTSQNPADSYWTYFTLGQQTEGFISMYQATGDLAYLGTVLDWVEAIIDAAEPCNTLGGGYSETDRLGWVSEWPSHDGLEIPLNESYGWRFVSRLLWVSRDETDPTFRARWEAVRDFTDAHIWAKWYNRSPANLYRSRTHMASHWAIIGMYVHALSEDATLRTQGDTVARNIMYAGMPADGVAQPGDAGASILGQMSARANPTDPAAAWFDDVWNRSDLPGSYMTYGENVGTASYFAWELGYPGFDDALMRKFARLYRPVLWRGDNTTAEYVDGTGTYTPLFHGGYAKFGHFVDSLQYDLQTSPNLLDDSPGNRTAWFVGNAAQSRALWQGVWQPVSPPILTLHPDARWHAPGVSVAAPVTSPGGELFTVGGAGSLPVGDAAYSIPSGAIYADYANGNDTTGDGTVSAPYKTVKHAVTQLATNGTLVLREGSYPESEIWWYTQGGTIMNYPGEEVWFDGADTTTNWTYDATEDAWWTSYVRSYVRENYWEYINGPKGELPTYIGQVDYDGVQMEQVASKAALAAGKWFQEGTSNGNSFTSSKVWIGSNPTGHTVTISKRGRCILLHAAGQTIKGVGWRRYSANISDMGVVVAVRADGLIENCVTQDCSVNVIKMAESYRLTLRNVTSTRSGSLGFDGWRCDDTRVEGCLVEYANYHGWPTAPASGGMKTTKAQRMTVVGCTFRNIASCALWFDEAVYDITVARCEFFDNNTGCYFEISAKGIVAGCVARNNNTGCYFFRGTDNVELWNSVAEDAGFGLVHIPQDARVPEPGAYNIDTRQPWSFYETEMTWQIGFANGIKIRNCVLSYTGERTGYSYPTHLRYATESGWPRDQSWQDAKIDADYNVYHKKSSYPTDISGLDIGNGLNTYANASTIEQMQAYTPPLEVNGAQIQGGDMFDSDYRLLAAHESLHGGALAMPAHVAALLGVDEGVKLMGIG